MPAKYTQEEIDLATEIHEDECSCGNDIWWIPFTGPNIWIEYARAIIKSRPQKEQLPLQFV
jgi:hypothetical protein